MLWNAVNISANRSYNPLCCETLWNAVNISANRSYNPPHCEQLWNAVNISANRSYNPPHCESCKTLWILVQTGHINPPGCEMLWILVQTGDITVQHSECFQYYPKHVMWTPTLWILVQTGLINPHSVKRCETLWNAENAVNISANRSYNPNAVNTVKCCEYKSKQVNYPMLWNMLWNISPNRSYNPLCNVKHCENGVNISANRSYYPPHCESYETLWILVPTGQLPPCCAILWILAQTGHIIPPRCERCEY